MYHPEKKEDLYNFWEDTLNLVGPYNYDIDKNVYDVVNCLASSTVDNGVDDISDRIGLSESHTELILNLLASAGWLGYGSSPRFGWLHPGKEQEYLDKFKQYIHDWWDISL